MSDDDDLCLCFHVSRRKVIQYIRVRRPRRASELSQCYGAGTGCGWCRPFLAQLLEREMSNSPSHDDETLPSMAEYAQQRAAYRRQREDASGSPDRRSGEGGHVLGFGRR